MSATAEEVGSMHYEDVTVGSPLPQLEVELNRSLIVAGAIATRDYQDVHHDPDLARQRGAPDIFMNILTTNGLVGRFVTDWSGPCGLIESIAIRLGAPNYPGDTMVLTGQVSSLGGPSERNEGRGVVDVEVRGRNSIGNHVTGTVRVALPIRGGAGDRPATEDRRLLDHCAEPRGDGAEPRGDGGEPRGGGR